ncbi:MAG: 30S ribosomal protein S16 [Nitrospirota bacterium]
MVKIRLARHGRHKRPFYRIVVADSQSPRNGRFIEVLGTYDPLAESAAVKVDAARTQGWLAQGAQATDTVRQLLKRSGVRAAAAQKVV